MIRHSLVAALLVLAPLHALVGPRTPHTARLVTAHPCEPGLYRQPDGGPFAAILFCDDALGSNLGLVCYAGAPCNRPPWDVTNRFWQGPKWAADVTAFAWDPNNTCLYVSSEAVYGEGDVYALDLPNRVVTVLPLEIKERLRAGYTYSTTLTGIDEGKGLLHYTVEYFDQAAGSTVHEAVSIPLPACGGAG